MANNLFQMIVRLQADYCRCIDGGDLESWPDFFSDDCVYRITTADNHRQGYEAGVISATSRGMLTDRVTALRQANIYERHSYRHILGQPAILEETERGALSETSFMVVRIMRDGTTDIYATGIYLDRHQIEGDVLKLAQRIVVCDSSRFDTLLALPL
jgi:anthranilate 1,2-dioxygenase small subunit